MMAGEKPIEGTVSYRVSPQVSEDELNELFAASWEDHSWTEFSPVLEHALAFVCAYQDEHLVGFVNLVWDRAMHAFILDTTVHPGLRRRGVGRELVRLAAEVAESSGVQWLHVDYEARLRGFYGSCGFRSTEAGLMWLGSRDGG